MNNRNQTAKYKDMYSICKEVSEYTRTNINDICGVSQRKPFTYPRHLVCYIANVYYKIPKTSIYPIETISSFLSKRNHSTIINSVRTIRVWRQVYPSVDNDVETILRRLAWNVQDAIPQKLAV